MKRVLICKIFKIYCEGCIIYADNFYSGFFLFLSSLWLCIANTAVLYMVKSHSNSIKFLASADGL